MMKNESGRSMVEMLGVLAIIGVLSVGGIAGYTMAMRKYKANEAMSIAAQCAMEARAGDMGNGIDSCNSAEDGKPAWVSDLSVKGSTGEVTITFTDADNALCLAAAAIKNTSTDCAGGVGTWTFS